MLKAWAFARNTGRQNVMPQGKDFVWSDTVGLLRDRTGDIHVTGSSKRYPEVVQLLNAWLRGILLDEIRSFTYTSINLNCNYAAKRHRDGNNFGPSLIAGGGKYTGGELGVWLLGRINHHTSSVIFDIVEILMEFQVLQP